VRSAASVGAPADIGATTRHGHDNRRIPRYLRAFTRTRVVQDRIPPTASEITAMDLKGEQTAFVYTTYLPGAH
jgi:hypothetical protein